MNGFNFLQFCAGVALFVYAMSLTEDSIKNLAGRSFKKFLQKQSKNNIKVIAASTAITAFLQSSSIVLMMVLSFVGSGLMSMRGALAAVLGSNLGTTLDSWVIAFVGFKISFQNVSFPLLAIALPGLLLFRRKSNAAYITSLLIGISFVFIALEWLKNCIDNNSIEDYFAPIAGLHYLIFIPIGFLITAIIQSSSATIAITLSSLYNGIIPFESAAAMVIGSELGTTLKFLIGSVGGIVDKKRVAWGNFFMNFITMLMASVFLQPIVHFIHIVMGIKDNLIALVAFQTGINLASMILFYPLLGAFADFLEKIFKTKEHDNLTMYIQKPTDDPFEAAKKETFHLLNETIELNKNALGITKKKSGVLLEGLKILSSGNSFDPAYKKIKLLQGRILEYISDIPKESMREEEAEKIDSLITVIRHVMRAAKNLKDIRHNLAEFKSSANDELFNLYNQMKSKADDFYLELQSLLNEPFETINEKISGLLLRNRKQYDEAIATLLEYLKENRIEEINSSSLINVYREIYSSHKALTRALADLRDMDT